MRLARLRQASHDYPALVVPIFARLERNAKPEVARTTEDTLAAYESAIA